jgi:GDP-4-dehydro-6-deoxy-D-mannose reductase
MRALVSGSTGFSGRYLSEALRSSGFELCAVSQRADAPGIERIDLTSSAAWSAVLQGFRPDHVFHLSGVTHSAKLADFALYNTAAAAALLDATLAQPSLPRSVLLVGTAAEYGLVPEAALPVEESFSPSPRSPYGVTKYAQTQLGAEAARKGLRVILPRPSNIVGPGMPRTTALGSFAQQIREIELGRRANSLSVGDLSTSRDFIDVRDVVAFYVALAARPDAAGVVNVSSGKHVTMRWILDQLIAEFEIPVSVVVESSRLRASEVQKFSASPKRLRELVGERELIPLADTLRDIVAYERATAQTV